MKKLLLITALLTAPFGAGADVYKCGATYSSTPCGNNAVKIETPAAPTSAPQTTGAKIIKTLTGKVVRVADGDTVTLDGGEKIRFAQIDTPEISHFGKPTQPFGKEAGAALRQMVAHTNKNRDTDGKVVFAGTSDVVDDCDCAFILDEVTKTDFNKQVLFENFKSRGDVAHELALTYSIIEKQSYKDLIDSVQLVDIATIEQAKKEKIVTVKREKDKHAIDAIIEGIKQGNHKRTDLVKFAMDKNNYGVPRQKVWDVLDRYTGEKLSNSSLWRVENCQTAKLYYILMPENVSIENYENAKNGY